MIFVRHHLDRPFRGEFGLNRPTVASGRDAA